MLLEFSCAVHFLNEFSVFLVGVDSLYFFQHFLTIPRCSVVVSDYCVYIVLGVVIVLYDREHFKRFPRAECVRMVIDGITEDSVHLVNVDRGNLHTPEVIVLADCEGVALGFGKDDCELDFLIVRKGAFGGVNRIFHKGSVPSVTISEEIPDKSSHPDKEKDAEKRQEIGEVDFLCFVHAFSPFVGAKVSKIREKSKKNLHFFVCYIIFVAVKGLYYG